MTNTVQAINALASLTSLVLRAAQAQQEVAQMIQRAQAEGRDLTAEEIAAVQGRRRDAVERWDALG